jgi:NAD(P)-dependent dehydrogenase (short-subunit alcohol dehydrogenase family)
MLCACQRAGGRALPVPADVIDAAAVEALANRALDAFGTIDAWVNNAAVSLFGRFEETPREDFEQVLRVNVLGTANGARTAIRVFREQGHGRLVNVSSMVGHAGQPFTSAYTTSKWAIRGFSESLRMELADERGITVSTILPASIDTPIYQHAANHTNRPVKALSPVYPPEQVAAAIVACVRRPRREVFVGNAGRALAVLRTLWPSLGERIMRTTVERDHFDDGPPVETSQGNLFVPAAGEGAVRGGWIARVHGDAGSGSGAGLALAAGVVGLGICLALAPRRTGRA